MTTIRADADLCTVLVTLTCQTPAIQEQILAIADQMLPIFAKQPGFISCAGHRSTDGTQIITYLQWRDRAAHDACQKSNDFGDLGPQLLAHLASGQASIDIKILTVTQVATA
jgi:quinol monooxygenase YgiN